jgi:hypothetical protein
MTALFGNTAAILLFHAYLYFIYFTRFSFHLSESVREENLQNTPVNFITSV